MSRGKVQPRPRRLLATIRRGHPPGSGCVQVASRGGSKVRFLRGSLAAPVGRHWHWERAQFLVRMRAPSKSVAASLGIGLASLTMGGVARSSLQRSWSHRPQATKAASDTAQRAARRPGLARARVCRLRRSVAKYGRRAGRAIDLGTVLGLCGRGRTRARYASDDVLAGIDLQGDHGYGSDAARRTRPNRPRQADRRLPRWTDAAGDVGDTRRATVRRVANHTGGLPIHEYSVYADEGRVLPPFIEIVRRYGILVRPPGERFEYSNLGYGLLEQAISHIAKRDFEVFMREEVFEPLGLSRMALGPNPRMTRETAARYARNGSVLPFYEMDTRGAIVSSEASLRIRRCPARNRIGNALSSFLSLRQLRTSQSPIGASRK